MIALFRESFNYLLRVLNDFKIYRSIYFSVCTRFLGIYTGKFLCPPYNNIKNIKICPRQNQNIEIQNFDSWALPLGAQSKFKSAKYKKPSISANLAKMTLIHENKFFPQIWPTLALCKGRIGP